MKVLSGAGLVAGFILLGLAGCQSASYQPDQPAMLSNRPIDAPNISPDMERFDANIGDTATRSGGDWWE